MRTATGEDTQVLGKVTCKIVIGKEAVLHNLIVADIVDEVITEVDFPANQEIKIDMKNRIYTNMETPLMFCYDNKYNVRQVMTTESQQIPPKSEAVFWAEIEGDYGPNKRWTV